MLDFTTDSGSANTFSQSRVSSSFRQGLVSGALVRLIASDLICLAPFFMLFQGVLRG